MPKEMIKMRYFLNEGRYILTETDSDSINAGQQGDQAVDDDDRGEYASFINDNITNGDKEKTDKILSFGQAITYEFEDLGFNESSNPFITYLSNICSSSGFGGITLDMLDNGNYAAIHNGYIKEYFDEIELTKVSTSNILICKDLYRQLPKDILNTYLYYYHQIKNSYSNNIGVMQLVLNLVFNKIFSAKDLSNINLSTRDKNGKLWYDSEDTIIKDKKVVDLKQTSFGDMMLSKPTEVYTKCNMFVHTRQRATALKDNDNTNADTVNKITAAFRTNDGKTIISKLVPALRRDINVKDREAFVKGLANLKMSEEQSGIKLSGNQITTISQDILSEEEDVNLIENSLGLDFTKTPASTFVQLISVIYNKLAKKNA